MSDDIVQKCTQANAPSIQQYRTAIIILRTILNRWPLGDRASPYGPTHVLPSLVVPSLVTIHQHCHRSINTDVQARERRNGQRPAGSWKSRVISRPHTAPVKMATAAWELRGWPGTGRETGHRRGIIIIHISPRILIILWICICKWTHLQTTRHCRSLTE